MALSVLHQTVSPSGGTFTPNLTLFGWFTIHWPCTTNLTIAFPTGLLVNGTEFIVDIIRDVTDTNPDNLGVITWDGPYTRQQTGTNSPLDGIGLWNGQGFTLAGPVVSSNRAMRHHFLLLNGTATLEAWNMIEPY